MKIVTTIALALTLSQSPDASTPQPPAEVVAAELNTTVASLDARLRTVADLMEEMVGAAAQVRDMTCTFFKREYKGEQLPQEVITLKYRAKPRSVYLKWNDASNKGQEALWREGWNAGKMRAHKGSFPDFTVDLGITSYWAMRSSRHPITLAGFEHTVTMLSRDFRAAVQRPECVTEVADLGRSEVYGATSRCFEALMDRKRCADMYADKARFCVNEALKLPNQIQLWKHEDGELRLVEDYGYRDVKVNVGLSDRDFDPDNDAYDF